MFSKLRANLPIMSTFFNPSSSPKEMGTETPADQNKSTVVTSTSPPLATHNALSSDTDAMSQKHKSSKPPSEKESTLVDEPIRDSTAPEDTNKGMTGEITHQRWLRMKTRTKSLLGRTIPRKKLPGTRIKIPVMTMQRIKPMSPSQNTPRPSDFSSLPLRCVFVCSAWHWYVTPCQSGTR